LKKTKIYQPFRFKQFAIEQNKCAMKVGTDGVLLGAWCNVQNCNTALDIGMGQASFEEATDNMSRSLWAKRLFAIHDKIQNHIPLFNLTFDLIVCNPPFFMAGTLPAQSEKSKVRNLNYIVRH